MAGTTAYVSSNNSGLTAENYNEMDAMVFSQLSYMKFDEVNSPDIYACGSSDGMSLQKFAEVMLNSGKVSDNEAALLTTIANSERYKDCTISNCMSTEQSTGTQWAAITVNIDSDTSVVAFRGTDGTEAGWTEDMYLAYGTGTEAQKLSAEYLEHCSANNIYATGHSKGGNDAIAGYVMADDATRAKISRIENFDGPGANGEMQQLYASQYAELDGKLTSYLPKDSVIGLLLDDHEGNVIFVDSIADNFFYEHDTYNWQFDPETGSFVRKEQSELSKFINKEIDKLLNEYSPEERAQLVGLICTLGIPAAIASMDFSEVMDKLPGILADLDPEHREVLLKLLSHMITRLGVIYLENQDKFGLDGTFWDDIFVCILMAADEKIAEKLLEVVESIAGFVDDVKTIIDGINKLIEAAKEAITNAINYVKETFDGTRDNTYIEVNPEALIQSASSMFKAAKDANDLAGEMQKIALRMQIYDPLLAGKTQLKVTSTSLLALKCARYGNALMDISEIYSSTENKVTGYAPQGILVSGGGGGHSFGGGRY